MENPSALGVALREMREARGLSLDVLGKRAGKSGSYVSRVELGVIKEPSFETIVKLCAGLGVTTHDLAVAAGIVPAEAGYTAPEPDAPSTRAQVDQVLAKLEEIKSKMK